MSNETPGSLLSVHGYHYIRGGAESVYFNHAELFRQKKWNIHYSSMHHDENIPCDDSRYFANNIDYAKGGGLLRKLKNASEIIYSQGARNKLSDQLDRQAVDIAHVHSVYHHQSPSVLYELKKRKIPTVLTAHDLKMICPAYKMMNSQGVCESCKGKKLWNVVANKCIKDNYAASFLIMIESFVHQYSKAYEGNVDYIIAPSRFYKNKFIEWGMAADKIIHIPNFINNIKIPYTHLPQDYVVYFGRLSNEKGLATLVRAAAKSGTRVKIAGTGPEGDTLKQLALDLDAPVEFLGYQSGDALWAIVDGARANVLPSEWYENGPMSAIEALARGKPMIGADIGGIPEMIEPGKTGWTFPSGDVEALAAALTHVRQLPDDTLLAMGEACKAYALTEHAPDVYYERMMAVYNRIRHRAR